MSLWHRRSLDGTDRAKEGPPQTFQKAVDAFDLDGFMAAVEHAGADYVLFTAAHALQMLPAPHPVIDRILPGRTCKRDLIRELADALAAKGKHLLVYYNHSCNHKDDPEWEQAVRLPCPQQGTVYPEHHGHRWPHGRQVQGEDQGVVVRQPVFPGSPRTAQLRHHGHDRLSVSVGEIHGNCQDGIPAATCDLQRRGRQDFLYTTHQDYWAGELVNLDTPAKGRYLDSGLQWFGWTCMEDRRWVHTQLDTPIPPPLYTDEQVIAFVRTCNKHMAPMTFNVGIYQDGTMAPASVEQLHRLNRDLRS